MKPQEVNFQKSQKTACLSGWEFEADKSRYGVYVTRHWNWMNSYWMFWIGCLRGARLLSSFCDFRKMTIRDLTSFSSFFDTEKSCVFQIFLLRSIKAYLCPNKLLLILIAWILVSVALKKWFFFTLSVFEIQHDVLFRRKAVY